MTVSIARYVAGLVQGTLDEGVMPTSEELSVLPVAAAEYAKAAAARVLGFSLGGDRALAEQERQRIQANLFPALRRLGVRGDTTVNPSHRGTFPDEPPGEAITAALRMGDGRRALTVDQIVDSIPPTA